MGLLDDFTCIFNSNTPNALFLCMDTMTGGILWNTTYIALVLFFTIGWSLFKQDPVTGMSVGGFICFLLGVAFAVLQWISLYTAFMPLILVFIGVALHFMTK